MLTFLKVKKSKSLHQQKLLSPTADTAPEVHQTPHQFGMWHLI